jgi:hypothetical protein
MPFDSDRKRLFVKTVELVVNKYETAQTDTERERAIIEALRVRDKFDEQDYPEISTSKEQPSAIITLGHEFNKFLAAMGQKQYAAAYKALKAVHNLIDSFQA